MKGMLAMDNSHGVMRSSPGDLKAFSALGMPNMPLQVSVSVGSRGSASAQSHTHMHSYSIDTIGPLCGWNESPENRVLGSIKSTGQ